MLNAIMRLQLECSEVQLFPLMAQFRWSGSLNILSGLHFLRWPILCLFRCHHHELKPDVPCTFDFSIHHHSYCNLWEKMLSSPHANVSGVLQKPPAPSSFLLLLQQPVPSRHCAYPPSLVHNSSSLCPHLRTSFAAERYTNHIASHSSNWQINHFTFFRVLLLPLHVTQRWADGFSLQELTNWKAPQGAI
jgi:hypothetical protein